MEKNINSIIENQKILLETNDKRLKNFLQLLQDNKMAINHLTEVVEKTSEDINILIDSQQKILTEIASSNKLV